MKTVLEFAATLACALYAAGVLNVAQAQDYPTKPVRVVVPFPPGGANDIVGRVVMAKLSEQMGRSFFIDNRSGAGGTVGTAVVAQSAPDGYTLMVQSSASHVSNAHLYKKLPYDPLRDFAAVAPLAVLMTVLTVHPSLPPRSVKEYIAFAKARPKEVMMGHAGVGSFVHMNTVFFESRTGVPVTQVPFKGGGPAVVGLISGETHAMLAGVGDIIEHLKVKRARPLGVSTLQRVKLLPDVPTIAETLPGYEAATWISVFAPAATPRPLIDRLSAELGKVLRDPVIAARLSETTYDAVPGSPDMLTQRLRAEHDTIGKLFRDFGVSAN
jgi:tripartite-type tricarboxylate transporter receptor subunit TctC